MTLKTEIIATRLNLIVQSTRWACIWELTAENSAVGQEIISRKWAGKAEWRGGAWKGQCITGVAVTMTRDPDQVRFHWCLDHYAHFWSSAFKRIHWSWNKSSEWDHQEKGESPFCAGNLTAIEEEENRRTLRVMWLPSIDDTDDTSTDNATGALSLWSGFPVRTARTKIMNWFYSGMLPLFKSHWVYLLAGEWTSVI